MNLLCTFTVMLVLRVLASDGSVSTFQGNSESVIRLSACFANLLQDTVHSRLNVAKYETLRRHVTW
jgi:hypothetical protein